MKARKTLALIMTAAIVVMGTFCGNGSTASATTIQRTSKGHSFKSAWEGNARIDSKSKLVYGYNTFLINEDYSHCNKEFSQAFVTNSNGTFKGNAALRTTWTKIEVTHAGNYIIYGAIGIG